MNKRTLNRTKSLSTTLFLTLIYSVMMIFFFYTKFNDIEHSIAGSITLFYFIFIFYKIMRTKNFGKWRNLYFTSMAIAFIIYILWELLVDGRGYMWITNEDILYSHAPQCNIVSLMNFLPLLVYKVDVFPSSVKLSIVLILIFLLLGGLIFGRGMCSWVCQFGGQDSLAASIPKKRRWKIKSVHPFFKYFPLAMLVFIVGHSFITMTPTYCVWICPFKSVTEFLEVNSILRLIQTIIFLILWGALVIILPLFTKKRTQCSLLCPMGAYYSVTNHISPFYVKINKEKCISCQKCVAACPTFSLSKERIEKGKPSSTCTKCGTCFSACPTGAIGLAIRGSKITTASPLIEKKEWKHPKIARFFSDLLDPAIFFIFPIYALSTFITFGYFSKVFVIIITLLEGLI